MIGTGDSSGRPAPDRARMAGFGTLGIAWHAAADKHPRMSRIIADTPHVGAENRTFVGHFGKRRLARITRVAPVRHAGDASHDTVVHRQDTGTAAVLLPAPRGIVWQARPALGPGAVLADRRNANTLILLMIALWAAILSFGIYKAMTPPSGIKIKWDDR